MRIVDCAGDGYARGRAHGQGARDLIHDALGRWEASTVAATGIPFERYVDSFVGNTQFVKAMDIHVPDLVDEIRGIADGAGIRFEILFAYNCMDEQWWWHIEQLPREAPGCSLMAVAGRRGRSALLAQNMDLPASMDGSQLMLRLKPDEGPEMLVLTSAGLIGLTGVGRTGVGICVNTLLMLEHSRQGLPVAAVLRGALAQPTHERAVDFLESAPHASGQHYAVASSVGITSLECSASGAAEATALDGRLSHTNHPLVSESSLPDLAERLARNGSIADSNHRLAFIDANIANVHRLGDAERILMDRTTPICVMARRERPTQTFGSVAFELGEPPRARFRAGASAQSDWFDVQWTT